MATNEREVCLLKKREKEREKKHETIKILIKNNNNNNIKKGRNERQTISRKQGETI